MNEGFMPFMLYFLGFATGIVSAYYIWGNLYTWE